MQRPGSFDAYGQTVEVRDVIVFCFPPLSVQGAIFGAIAPIAGWAWLSRDVPAALAQRAGPRPSPS